MESFTMKTAAWIVLTTTLASGCGTAPPVSRSEAPTEAWVRGYYELFHRPDFDLDGLMGYYASDVRFVDPTFDIDVSGSEEVRALYQGIGTEASLYRGITWDLDRILLAGSGDVVIHGTWSGSFQEKPFEIEFVTLWKVEDGLIIEQRDFFDAPTFDAQVGWNEESNSSNP